MELIDHWRFMSQFLTDNRKQKFEEVLSKRSRQAIPILEDAAKEQNASAVLRTIDALGFHEVHLIENEWKVQVNSDISKRSDKWLDVHLSNSTSDTIDSLKRRGYAIAVTSPHSTGKSIRQLPID